MIAAARSCFSGYRFDGGTTNCLRVFVVPRWLGAAAVHLVSCRHIFGHACLISPGVGVAFSFLARAHVISPVVASYAMFLSSASLGGGYVPGACPHSHHLINHLVRRGRSFLSSSCSASSHRCPFFSSGATIVQRTESVASHQSLRLVLIELGKTARNMISRSSSSDAPRSSRSSSRFAVSCGVSCLIVIGVVARSGGAFLAVLLVSSHRGGASFVYPAARRRACPHPSPIVSSLVSFSDALRAVGGA